MRKVWKRVTGRMGRRDGAPVQCRVVFLALLLLVFVSPSPAQELPSFTGEHVVLVIWDGLRPDFITPENTPTLHQLATGGVFFANHHSVYVTSTEVNGTALATGCWPERNHIIANREYRPGINRFAVVPTENPKVQRIGDIKTRGKYIAVPTIAEIVQRAGFPTMVAGAKDVATVQDRRQSRITPASKQSIVLHAGASFPLLAIKNVVAQIGPWPTTPESPVAPNANQNTWTTRALTEVLWKNGVPKFSVLWLSDPDYTQHRTSPGAPEALEAIRNSDTNLATLLAALDAKGVRSKTNIFIASDHGFSTVDRVTDVVLKMRQAGLSAVRGQFTQTPKLGQVLVNSLGGSVFFYVLGHKPGVIQRIVNTLQNGDFAGPIFTRIKVPGTFPMADGKIGSPAAPDVAFAFRWQGGPNEHGSLGTLVSEGFQPGLGTHGSLSPYDTHNTLVAAGPDIRPGVRNELPSSNIDVAPTILHLLGLQPPVPMDGRILHESLVGGETWPVPEMRTETLTAERAFNGKIWRQYLKRTWLGDHLYIDEGNGNVEAPEILGAD